MFQILDIKVPMNGKVIIDDQLKSEYKGGITGLTIWTKESKHMRLIEIELDIDSEEVFPAGFPAELYSSNQFRNTQPLQLSFPKESKIEGSIIYKNAKPEKDDPESIDISLIFYVKLKE